MSYRVLLVVGIMLSTVILTVIGYSALIDRYFITISRRLSTQIHKVGELSDGTPQYGYIHWASEKEYLNGK